MAYKATVRTLVIPIKEIFAIIFGSIAKQYPAIFSQIAIRVLFLDLCVPEVLWDM